MKDEILPTPVTQPTTVDTSFTYNGHSYTVRRCYDDEGELRRIHIYVGGWKIATYHSEAALLRRLRKEGITDVNVGG